MLFDAAMVEEVVLGATVVEGDVVVVFTAVVEVVGFTVDDVVVALGAAVVVVA